MTSAHTADVTQLLPMIEAIPPVAGKIGRPRRRPKSVYADRAYDSRRHRDQLRNLGIEPFLAKRNTEAASESIVGWSNALTAGFTNSAVSAFATNDVTTSTKPS